MQRTNGYKLGARPKKKSKEKDINLQDSPKLCVILWVDAVTDTGWDVGKSHTKVDDVLSIGWLVHQSDTEIILASDISMDREGLLHTNRRIAIPAQWIKSMEVSDE